LNFVTIDGNAAEAGGGLFRTSGIVQVHNSIIAGNSANANDGPDVNGLFLTLGHNFIGVTDAANPTSFTNGIMNDQVGAAAAPLNPLLGPLQNNGGPTFTQELMPGSLAIGRADTVSPPSTDQRGFARPGAGQTAPSIGAFQTQTPSYVGTTTNGAFVENLYETLLGRTADSGAVGFVNALKNGASPAAVVLAIESTTEYHSIVIQGLYETYLHRAADPAGLQNWLNFLAAGGTVEQIAAALIGSPEYFQLHGGTNEAFLTSLYWDVLGRGGSPAEQAGFLQMLNSGTSTTQVANLILSSTESLMDQVTSIYLKDLGRAPDAAGIAGWVAALQHGMSPDMLQADILGSGEAFANRS
jgi:hypothetical protein